MACICWRSGAGQPRAPGPSPSPPNQQNMPPITKRRRALAGYRLHLQSARAARQDSAPHARIVRAAVRLMFAVYYSFDAQRCLSESCACCAATSQRTA